MTLRDFKIRKVDTEYARLNVEIEFLDNGDRRKFGYPQGEGWDQEFNGEMKFVTDIKRHLENEANVPNTASINALKSKMEGQIIVHGKAEKATKKAIADKVSTGP